MNEGHEWVIINNLINNLTHKVGVGGLMFFLFLIKKGLLFR